MRTGSARCWTRRYLRPGRQPQKCRSGYDPLEDITNYELGTAPLAGQPLSIWLGLMTFRRPPAPPPRALEIFALGFGISVLIGMLIYFVDSVSRGLITWSEVPYLQTGVLMGYLPMFAISYVLRRRRLKKALELREYERTLATLAEHA